VGKNSCHLPIGVKCFPIEKHNLIESKSMMGHKSTKLDNKTTNRFNEYSNPEKIK
jgi:hypothetical protein